MELRAKNSQWKKFRIRRLGRNRVVLTKLRKGYGGPQKRLGSPLTSRPNKEEGSYFAKVGQEFEIKSNTAMGSVESQVKFTAQGGDVN